MSEEKKEDNMEMYYVPAVIPIAQLEVAKSIEALTAKERLYTHYLSRACWAGSEITLSQVSTESPSIFSLFRTLFAAPPIAEYAKAALEAGIPKEDWNNFLNYAATFFTNMGNYLSFGDSKFIPRCSQEAFSKVVRAHPDQTTRDKCSEIMSMCITSIFSVTVRNKSLGFPEEGISTYYGPNVTSIQIKTVNDFMVSIDMSPYNTRVFLADDGTLEIRVASSRKKQGALHEFKGEKIQIIYGDHSDKLSSVVENLKQAKKYARNDIQTKMFDAYILHFQNGNIDDHKAAQKEWVTDVGPVVETNIGFIESYRDPSGVRGEFEGFVSIVNKDTSKKFAVLVENAPDLLRLLPWPKNFEKDEFRKPDFTSLEIVSFTGSGIPAGINIPNYDDIRQNFGFKNVSLGNVISSRISNEKVKRSLLFFLVRQPRLLELLGHNDCHEQITFLRDEDQELYQRLSVVSFEVQVGCHELLGHGSGKLFVEDSLGKFNFDKTATQLPGTQTPISSWYKPGSTYDSMFGPMGSSFEECRAECVGLYLSTERKVLSIFGHCSTQEQDDVEYINWLNMVRAGLCALEMYTPEQKKWRQAHMQARYAILQVLLEAGQGLVTLIEENNCLSVALDRSKIQSVGKPAIEKFLCNIQIFKATANVDEAKEMYNKYTSVEGRWARELRDIVIANKKPRKQFVQIHSELNEDGSDAVFKTFEASPAGIIESCNSHFS